MIRVSVVVPTFERPGRLPGLVAALEGQTLPPDEFEVIVSDDGSQDETPAVLADLSSRTRLDLRVVRMPQNGGAGPARNLGWRACRGPVVAFTDDDCVPSPVWLEAALARMDQDNVGIVQGRTLPDPAVDSRYGRTLSIERLTKRYETCNIFYRTDVLRAAGGFDESEIFRRRPPPFGEDTDLGWKAHRSGATEAFAAAAVVFHAVTRPTVGYKWRFGLQHANWATLVRRYPEIRREMLTYRVFTRRVHLGFIAALAGAAVSPFWLPAAAFALPYAWHRRPRTWDRDALTGPFWDTLFDAMNITGLIMGSIRERTLVL